MEYDIEEILYNFEDDYNPGPRPMNQGPRNMYNQGQLVQPSDDGSRPGYAGDRKTVHLVRETGNPNHSGIYRTTNTKTGSVSYRGQFNRRNEGGFQATPSRSTIKQARIDLDEAMANIPKGKSIIELQKERGAGNLLNDKKFINQLEKAFEEVSNLEKKGYGNIDNIVKKYQKKFYKKVGTKNIDGSTVKKGTDNVFTKTLAKEIREYAKDLNIYGIENPNMEKALNDYRRIKNPKRGMIGNIANRYNIDFKTFDRYITKLGQRKYIPIQDPGEYTKAIRDAEKKAIKKFSDRYFERVLSAPMTSGKFFADAADDEVVRLQKSHLGDKLTQDVKTSNIGYAAQEINQEVLKDVDKEMRQLNKKLAKLYKNKPEGYLKEMDMLNQRGNDLAAATKGYKKFTGIDPYTGKEFTINFSSPSQELDPTELLGENTKLADIDKQDKATVKNLKTMSIENASKTKTQVQSDIKEIASNLEKLGCGKAAGGRILMSNGGATLTKCAIKGQQKLNLGLTNGFDKTEGELAKKILQAGRGLGSMFALRNILGPAAVGFTVAAEAGLVGYDMLSTGKSFKEAVGDSLFNYALGDKTQIDNKKLRYQGYADAGVDANQIGKISAYENAIDEINNLGDEFNEENRLYNIAANQKGKGRMDPRRYEKTKQQQVENFYDQADKNKALIQDLARTQTEDRLDKALDPMVPALMSDADAKRKAMQLTKPTTVKFGNFMDTVFPKGFLSDTTYAEDRNKAINYMPEVQEYYRGNRFARGGLSGGDTSGRPPESGPMSQGLRSLYKNGRKL